MGIGAGLPLVSILPRRFRTVHCLMIGRGLGTGRDLGFSLIVIPRPGRARRLAPCRSVVLHGCVETRDPRLVGLHRACGIRETVCKFSGDLKPCVAVENLDGANFGFRHIAGTAEERQQPPGIGLALAPDINPEPHPLATVIPRRTLWAAAARGRAIVLILRRVTVISPVLAPLPRFPHALTAPLRWPDPPPGPPVREVERGASGPGRARSRLPCVRPAGLAQASSLLRSRDR